MIFRRSYLRVAMLLFFNFIGIYLALFLLNQGLISKRIRNTSIESTQECPKDHTCRFWSFERKNHPSIKVKEVFASQGNLSLRVDPDFAHYPKTPEIQVVLVGGSFVYGQGLDFSQSLQHKLQDRLNQRGVKARVRSLAFKAGSLINVHLLFDEIIEGFDWFRFDRPTTFIYLAPSFHFNRIRPRWSDLLSDHEGRWPVKTSDNEIRLSGFNESPPVVVRALRIFHKMGVVSPALFYKLAHVFGEEWDPHVLSASASISMIEILTRFRSKVEERFKKAELIVVPFPFYQDQWKSILDEVPATGCSLVWLADPPGKKADYFLAEEGHPSALMNEYLAEQLTPVVEGLKPKSHIPKNL